MYFTSSDYNKFMSEIIDTKIKELVNKSNISRFINDSDLNKKIETLATKAELNAEQDKLVKLETYDLNYFLGKIFVGDDDSKNIFV